VPAGVPSALPGPSGSGPLAPPPPIGGPQEFGGFPAYAIPGNAGFAPPPAIMPPGNFGPSYDPTGIGPVGGNGPPPGPMYPNPGPYAEQLFQPSPPMPTLPGGLQNRDLGYGNAPRWWAEGEYLLWFTKGQPVRFPLLTTSAPSDAGLLGNASTTVLVGGTPLGYNAINGLRIGTGFFGDADRRFGFEIYGFILERASNIQTFGSLSYASGIPTFARPFIDATSGTQNTVVLSGPDFGPAQVVVGTNTQTWGISPEGVLNLFRSEPGSRLVWSLDLTAGYRYIYEKEELWIYSRSALDQTAALPQFQAGPFGTVTALPAVVGAAQGTFGGEYIQGPAMVTIQDRFTAINQFNGFSIGFKSDARYGMFTCDSFAKIAIGDMHERVNIVGGGYFTDSTGISGSNANVLGAAALGVGGGSGAAVGGVLANAGNIGTHVQDKFTYIPEVGLNFGIALTKGLTGYIGGNFLYFPNIVRPGNLVDPYISSAAIPFSSNYGAAGAPRGSSFQMVESDHWIGGLTCGLILKY
jgi:hypothetical protein